MGDLYRRSHRFCLNVWLITEHYFFAHFYCSCILITDFYEKNIINTGQIYKKEWVWPVATPINKLKKISVFIKTILTLEMIGDF